MREMHVHPFVLSRMEEVVALRVSRVEAGVVWWRHHTLTTLRAVVYEGTWKLRELFSRRNSEICKKYTSLFNQYIINIPKIHALRWYLLLYPFAEKYGKDNYKTMTNYEYIASSAGWSKFNHNIQ